MLKPHSRDADVGSWEIWHLRLNVGEMLTCLAKIVLPACGRRCVLELKKAVLGVQSEDLPIWGSTNVSVVFRGAPLAGA